MKTLRSTSWLTAVLLCAAAPAVHAQFAVIDVASLTQLVSEVQTLEQQLATARAALAGAGAVSGHDRGSRHGAAACGHLP